MCFIIEDTPSFYRAGVVRARKPHRCSDCRGVISAQTEYMRVVGAYDGNILSDALCRRCLFDRSRIRAHEIAEGCGPDEAEPAISDLIDGLDQCGLSQTDPADVPEEFRP